MRIGASTKIYGIACLLMCLHLMMVTGLDYAGDNIPENLHVLAFDARVNKHAFLRRYTILKKSDVRHKVYRRDDSREVNREISIDVDNHTFLLSVVHNTKLFRFAPVIYTVGSDGINIPFQINNQDEFFIGKVIGDEESRVLLHIHDDVLKGTIMSRNETFSIEPSGPLFNGRRSDDEMIIYSNQDLKWPRVRGVSSGFCPVQTSDLTNNAPKGYSQPHSRRTVSPFPANKNTCLMGLQADYRFFVANGQSVVNTINSMLSTIAFADSLYRTIEFGVGQHLGLGVQEIFISTNSSTDPLYLDYSGTNAHSYLLSNFSIKAGFANWPKLCVGHLFTHYGTCTTYKRCYRVGLVTT